jgi:uncharacterized membrane protein
MRSFLIGLVIFCLLLVGTPRVQAEEITRFENTIRVTSDGKIHVQEDIQYDFGSDNRHGIFRTIPMVTTNSEGKRFILEFSDIAIVDSQKQEYQYNQTNSEGTISLKIGDPDVTITGSHLYSISYTAAGALTYFSDHDELYWNVTGNDWNVPIRTAIARIQLPTQIQQEDVRIACFTGGSGSTEELCDFAYNPQTSTASVQTTRALSSYEGLTIVVGFPKGVVAVLEPKEYVPFWETQWGKIVLASLIFMAICWYILAPLLLPFLWWNYGRDPKPLVGEASAWFEPPKTKYGRLLTPGETGTLVDERADNADITATIIDLARRGYLKIIEKTKGAIDLKKIATTVRGDELQAFEKTLFSGIFKTTDTISLKTADLIKVVTETKNKLYESVVSEDFFPKNPQTVRNMYTIGSVVALMTGNFLLFFSMLFFGYHMPRKTIRGAGAAAIARALKNFISSQERQFTFQAQKQMLFEKMLPFAIAFGVEKLWIARFAELHITRPDWYQGYSSTFHVIALADSLKSASSSVTKAATPVSSSTGHSSGFSGGSSGGGGGGGGGGSW